MNPLKNMSSERRAGTVFFALMLITVFVATVALYSVQEMRVVAQTTADRYEPALNESLRLHNSLMAAQLSLTKMAQAEDQSERRDLFAEFAHSAAIAMQQRNRLGVLTEGELVAEHLLADFDAVRADWAESARGMYLVAEQSGSAGALSIVSSQTERSFTMMSVLANRIATAGVEPSVMLHRQQFETHADGARNTILTALLIGMVLGSIIIVGSIQVIRMRKVEEQTENDYRDFDRRVQRALQLVDSEEEVVDIIHDALDSALEKSHNAELLMADTERSNVKRITSSTVEQAWEGCQVRSPEECPTMRRNSRMVFSSNRSFEACSHFKSRNSTPLSATCIPVSVAGHTVGVVHVLGPEHDVLDNSEARMLDSIALKAGDRIGMARALTSKDQAANTDSLTGLANRRALETVLPKIKDEFERFAVAYGDLDHFKRLNDEYGHEVGDRALRLFADVFRATLRPSDFVARWGGEEFIAVFPGGDRHAAVRALERVRERLAERLADSSLPKFTASFGISDSTMASEFDDILHRADAALSCAKKNGRNRVEYDDQVRADDRVADELLSESEEVPAIATAPDGESGVEKIA